MSSTRTRLFGVMVAGLACVSLAGCMTPKTISADVPPTPLDQFPPTTSLAPTGIQLAPHAYGLSPPQADALRELVADWRINGEGLILVETPACNCDEAAATAFDTRDAMVAFGAPADAIRMLQYDGGPAGAVRVSFQRLEAKVYDCGKSWDDLTKSGDNRPDQNFGCAVHSNLAAIVDNPADLVRPRAVDPPSAARRQVIIERYNRGEATTSEANEGSNAVLSNVGQGQ